MKFYEIEGVNVSATIPARMRNKTAQEICKIIFEQKGEGKAFDMLKSTSDAVFDPTNWKNPIYAKFIYDAKGWDAKEWVKAAVIWYHGCTPSESFIGVYSQGYSC